MLDFSLSLSALNTKSPPPPLISDSGVPVASLSVSLIVGVVASMSKVTLGLVVPIPTFPPVSIITASVPVFCIFNAPVESSLSKFQ